MKKEHLVERRQRMDLTRTDRFDEGGAFGGAIAFPQRAPVYAVLGLKKKRPIKVNKVPWRRRHRALFINVLDQPRARGLFSHLPRLCCALRPWH